MKIEYKKNNEFHSSKMTGSFFGKTNASPFFSSALFIQPKLTIGLPDEPYEREADIIADKVMRLADEEVLQTNPSPVPIQRKCASCERKEKIQMKGEGNGNNEMNAPSAVHHAINSGGQPLSNDTKKFMESRLGYDFGNVRVHNDSLAHQSSADINALAYTHDRHIVFGAGQYRPDTNSGKQLLAHELVHVIQQSGEFKCIQKAPDDGGDKFKRRPPGKGAFSDADYKDWKRRHPKSSFHNGGPHEPDAFYKRYTPEWFWRNGYFYALSRYAGFKGGYFEIWLSNNGDGKEISVFRGDIAPSAGKGQDKVVSPPKAEKEIVTDENPANLDPDGDFEQMFGEEIRESDRANVAGKRGFAIEYADGTIVFNDEDGAQMMFKPRKGADEIGYDVYDSDGAIVENLVWGMDPDELFE